MKKTIVFLVSLLIVISLAACGNSLSRAGQSSAELNSVESSGADDVQGTKTGETQEETSDAKEPDLNDTEGNNTGNLAAVSLPEEFVLIQGGTFQMGSPEEEAWRLEDEAEHTVTVSDFYMSAYELTQAEYQEITGKNPSSFPGEDLPVENISWVDAVSYCNARSERKDWCRRIRWKAPT